MVRILQNFNQNNSCKNKLILSAMENTIRVERAKKKITQAELAERVDVSRQTIHAIETGKFIPNTVLALKIARYFKVRLEDIFTLEETD